MFQNMYILTKNGRRTVNTSLSRMFPISISTSVSKDVSQGSIKGTIKTPKQFVRTEMTVVTTTSPPICVV